MRTLHPQEKPQSGASLKRHAAPPIAMSSSSQAHNRTPPCRPAARRVESPPRTIPREMARSGINSSEPRQGSRRGGRPRWADRFTPPTLPKSSKQFAPIGGRAEFLRLGKARNSSRCSLGQAGGLHSPSAGAISRCAGVSGSTHSAPPDPNPPQRSSADVAGQHDRQDHPAFHAGRPRRRSRGHGRRRAGARRATVGSHLRSRPTLRRAGEGSPTGYPAREKGARPARGRGLG